MADLSRSELRRLDLTLLLVLLGLVRHRRATLVAAELGLTPAAVSQALRRLRDIFGDALFLRRPHGLEPTATALALEAPVTAAVDALRGALGTTRAFDPATADGILRLAALDAEQAVLLPPLGRRAAVEALRDGRVDLALGFLWERPDTIVAETLYEEGFLVAGRPEMLSEAPRLGLDAYVAAEHILVSPPATCAAWSTRPLSSSAGRAA